MFSGERITQLREARGLSKARLADAAKISRTYLGQIESGESIPSIDVAGRLAGQLDVSVDVVLGSAPPPSASRPAALLEQAAALIPEPIPHHEGVAGANPEDDLFEDLIIAEPRRVAGRRRRVLVRGDCMEPDIPDGATVIVNTDREPEDGEPIVVRHCGRVLCKTLVSRNGYWTLRCVKPGYPDVRVRPGDEMVYLGVVEQVLYRPPRRRAS